MKSKYLQAGVAKSDITTDEPGIPIADRMYAKALVIDDGASKIAIVTMDVTAIGGRSISDNMLYDVSDEFLPKLRKRIEDELDIPGENVLVNASHTHPPGQMLCNDKQQLERTFDAVARAMKGMRNAKMGSGTGNNPNLTINRTLKLRNGKSWTARHTNPSPPDDEIASFGPVDDEIGVIRIDDTNGTPMAVVYNFACHPLFGDAKGSITANYPGIASKVIEERLKGTTALFIQGAAGDVMDLNFKTFSVPRDVKPMATELALEVLKVIDTIKTKDVELEVVTETVDLPRREDVPELIDELLNEQAELLASLAGCTFNFKTFLPLYIQYKMDTDHPLDHSYRYLRERDLGLEDFPRMDDINRANIAKYLANIATMEKLARIQDQISTLKKHKNLNDKSGEKTIRAEIQGIRIGDCAILASPLELLTQIGLNLKSSSPFKHTLVAGYSNGYMHYGAPASYYEAGGYEVTECLLAPEWQKIFETKSKEIAEQLRKLPQ